MGRGAGVTHGDGLGQVGEFGGRETCETCLSNRIFEVARESIACEVELGHSTPRGVSTSAGGGPTRTADRVLPPRANARVRPFAVRTPRRKLARIRNSRRVAICKEAASDAVPFVDAWLALEPSVGADPLIATGTLEELHER
jgi:hypothetical protein